MPWYEDDELWSGFAEVMFSAERRVTAAEVVAGSPLFRFPAAARVLDQCCGIGVFTEPLARQGYRVTGVDLSARMLAETEKSCADAGLAVELVHADMRDFRRPDAFDVVLNLFTSFGYFDTPEENQRVLRNAHDSLVPGGQLLVDVMGKETYAAWAGQPKVVPIDGGQVFMHDRVFDDWTRFTSEWTLVRGDTARHGGITCFVYSGAELRALFEAAGFTDVACFGGFDASPYDNRATRLIVRGVRPA